MSQKNIVKTAFRDAFTFTFQKSPILLTGGIITNWGNSALTSIGKIFKKDLVEDHPIGQNFPVPLTTLIADAIGAAGDYSGKGLEATTSGKFSPEQGLDNLLFDFKPIHGENSSDNTVLYSTALSKDPQSPESRHAPDSFEKSATISMDMTLAAHTPGYYLTTLGVAYALSAIFKSHAAAQGKYIILTPSMIWTGMTLTKFSEITDSLENGSDIHFQLDFQKFPDPPQTTKMKKNETLTTIGEGRC